MRYLSFVIIITLLNIGCSSVNYNRTPANSKPNINSKILVVQGPRADEIIDKFAPVLVKTNVKKNLVQYQVVLGSSCIMTNASSELHCDENLISSGPEADDLIQILEGSFLTYAGSGMGRTYFDVQHKTCQLSHPNDRAHLVCSQTKKPPE